MTAQDFETKYFGPSAVSPYQSTLTVNSVYPPAPGTASSNGINPEYCATVQAALDLASVLGYSRAQIIEGPPFQNWSLNNLYTQSGLVPFFKVTGTNITGDQVTVYENVGQLIDAFSHGYPVSMVLPQVQEWIASDLSEAQPQ